MSLERGARCEKKDKSRKNSKSRQCLSGREVKKRKNSKSQKVSKSRKNSKSPKKLLARTIDRSEKVAAYILILARAKLGVCEQTSEGLWEEEKNLEKIQLQATQAGRRKDCCAAVCVALLCSAELCCAVLLLLCAVLTEILCVLWAVWLKLSFVSSCCVCCSSSCACCVTARVGACVPGWRSRALSTRSVVIVSWWASFSVR